MPLPLSVAIVCKNNIATIGRTIESVRGVAGEIVAVDSGSTDGTIELLEAAGVRVIRSRWLGHVKTKQLALEACTGEWILCLDSDESLDETARDWVKRITLGQDEGADGFWVNRVVYYQGTPLRHAWQPEWRLRLVRRGRAHWTGLDPHDQLVLTSSGSRQEQVPGFVRHDSIDTWSSFLVKQAQHARTMAASLHAAGTKPSYARLIVSPLGAFVKQFVFKQAWRDGWLGWMAAVSAATGAAMKHMTLFELARGGTPPVAPNPNKA